ncbi:MAG TPA: glucans biosynthesis glucosyltransferase MdoH, partial [Ideonella sp.]|nr:glucans biosynthesis glucosyltransferase MdoH [Ideonella sp.]
PKRGATWLEQALLVLFGVLFAWISAGFWTAVMGLIVLWRGDRAPAMPESDALPSGPRSRTAIVMPICNEHVATVFGGLRATFESLQQTGELAHFDFFVLSDTGRPDVRAAEQAAWSALVRDLGLDAPGAEARIHYRWRQLRRRRKAGNVADFCRRWGHAYRYMVVLDADSVMTGECLTALVRRMEAQPDAGIIQTAPSACGHETLHARAQQFGSRVYGPLFTAGMRFWQLGESHYWGHNAILRIEPFMRHCALSAIAGRGSLAGDIMSHDFVEAALMRRAGWKVWIAHDLDGSYEQVPPNLIAEVQRDRRWCHGNLQNSRLMFEPGLHPVHRSVFLTGVLAYLSAPLWLGFLLLSTLLFTTHHGETPHYFLEPFQLFPIWPTANLELMLTLFGFTALLLLLPKVLALGVIVARREARHYGGAGRLLLGGLLEFVYSTLLAPVRMLFHSQFVFAALTGWRMDWKSPPREDDATPWSEAWRRHGLHTLLAVAWVAALVLVGTSFPWWLSPIIGGLLLAVPLSVWASRRGPGAWLRRHDLLLIPEEIRLPDVLAAAQRHAATMPRPVGFVDAVLDAPAHAAVLASIAAGAAQRGGDAQRAMRARVERALALGPHGLSDDDRLRLLGDASALATLRESVLHSSAHPDWRLH